MDIKLIEQKLNDISGFKPLFKGFFGGGKVKKSFAVYSEAEKKGVYPLLRLRLAKHEDSQYAVYAFSPEGKIADEVLKDITERVADLSLGTIRYECISYSRLEEWRGEEGSNAYENIEITGIAPEYPNVLVFPVADEVNCEYVIYAQKGSQIYIYPMTTQQAEDIAR